MLIGLVQLVPLIWPKAEDLVRALSIGVVVLMVLLLIIAFFFGKTTQAKYEEHLRLRTIRFWRRLSRTESRYMSAQGFLGAWSMYAKAIRGQMPVAQHWKLRRAQLVALWMRLSADRFDDAWLRFQRVRNDYLTETGRPRKPVLETKGVIHRSKHYRTIGKIMAIRDISQAQDSKAVFGDLFPAEANSRIAQEMQLLVEDPFMIYWAEREAEYDTGRDDIVDSMTEMLDRLKVKLRDPELSDHWIEPGGDRDGVPRARD